MVNQLHIASAVVLGDNSALTVVLGDKFNFCIDIATGVAISVGQHDRPPSESRVATRVAISVGQHGISALENEGLKSRYEGNYCDKEILGGTGQSSTMQQQIKEVKNHDIPSKNLPLGDLKEQP
ncbi:hypothetical protein L1987_81078 [Smallanthus sonchifolius]|uniref:Uncharacterized protein n=1 Tax=Smallanthus sonchifolius TaxID=185202 RepID=A0ACB8YQ14_9ASTR|nr:hypothetical protein L1987_81078 [Smallanthus sonchifolius]